MRERLRRKIAENLKQPKGFFGRLMGRFMNHFNKGIIQFTLEQISDFKSDSIAEAGIGSGMALQLCNKRFPKAMMYGIDISELMISAAGSRNKKIIKNGSLKLYHANISELPLADASVDVFYTINTIYFWNDPDEVFKEVHRVLKKDGHFIISFNPKEEMNPSAYPSDLFKFYGADQVGELALRNKFKLISSLNYQDRYEKYVCLIVKK
jgi:ubiquinone/menaquinone biosynthesis C-methylase UbiE